MHWVARKRLGRLEVVKGQRRRPVAIKSIEALVGRPPRSGRIRVTVRVCRSGMVRG